MCIPTVVAADNDGVQNRAREKIGTYRDRGGDQQAAKPGEYDVIDHTPEDPAMVVTGKRSDKDGGRGLGDSDQLSRKETRLLL
jgi:hypothetical protein